MVGVLASCAGDRGFEYRSGQIKYYEIGMCCSSAKQAALRRKIKDVLAENQDLSHIVVLSIPLYERVSNSQL
jgi:hypothetical protein